MIPLAALLAAGPVPTVYGGGPLSRGLAASLPLIGPAVRAISLHTTTSGGSFAPGTLYPDTSLPTAAAALRAQRPGVRLWCGIGVDAIARRVRSGAWSRQQGVDAFVGVARGARDVGADAVVWNAEAQWRSPDRATRDALDALAADALAAVARAVSELHQAHTAYASVLRVPLPGGGGWGGFGDYAWAFIGPASPVVVTFAQVYPGIAERDGAVIAAGVLPEWIARSKRSYALGADAGLVGRQVAVRHYLSLHGVPAADTAAVARAESVAMLWAVPGTTDAHGRAALAAVTGGSAPGTGPAPAAPDAPGLTLTDALAWSGLGAGLAAAVAWWRRRRGR